MSCVPVGILVIPKPVKPMPTDTHTSDPTLGQRRENRFAIQSIVLPFLGSRVVDHAVFQYILQDVSATGLKIGLPRWLVSKISLKRGDRVDFHLPFRFDQRNFRQGRIVWVRPDHISGGQECGVYLNEGAPPAYPVFISFETSEIAIDLKEFSSRRAILQLVLKDVMLLKEGLLIYLKHLVPYLSRLTRFSTQDFDTLRAVFFDDLLQRIEASRARLQALYDQTRTELTTLADIGRIIDLEELRMLTESEIYPELFDITFESGPHTPYINAIKQLERKMYANHNTIVMLYIKSLQ